MMDLNIVEQHRNDLLEREEYRLEINHAGDVTPSQQDVRKKLAAEQDLDPLTIDVDSIYSSSGRGFSRARVLVYDEPIMDEADLPSEEPEPAEEPEEEAAADDAEQAEEPEEADAEEDAEADAEEASEDAAEEADEADADADETEDEEEKEGDA